MTDSQEQHTPPPLPAQPLYSSPNSLDRFKATLEHINQMKALERYVQAYQLREAYLISVLKAVQHEEREMNCLSSHCRDLVDQSLMSVRSEQLPELERAYMLLHGLEKEKCCGPTVRAALDIMQKYRGAK